ncbi:snRNA-activating protein complex subunit 4 [Zootermopsis nevadensis]|uniref:snRNA-activating protein complex subunit 4 n=1 Tax=Zootermopsis nevadensis TaxID=136037 RepID=A0A067R4V6_ZOONE|nr:snRNA-activating protein complex subunit 4 [Zootermopsis nevadensis]KDR18290.1 snRNA-activating protein complex subunit 4 [Zootermopsis nevadensis]
MEKANEDVYYTDIASLREVLAAPSFSDENNDVVEELENNGSFSDEETFDSGASGNDESTFDLSHPHLDLKNLLTDESASPLRMCRTVGSACYDMLIIMEKELVTLLKKNKAKVKDLQDHIDSVKIQNEKSLMTRSNWYYMFGIPYFKDRHYFPCPPNEDYLRKTANMELNIIDLPVLKQWKDKDKLKLMTAVKAQEIANQIKVAEAKKQSILKALDCEDNSSKAEELENKFKDCNPACIETKSLAELVGFNKSEYDWMKISVVDLEGLHSAEECRAMWHNYLHPMIRKSKWTKDEDDKLKELVVKYENQNWDAIAQELGTQRSAYQCMFQYQTRLNDSLRRSKWTKEEDDYLKETVERCRFGSYIPWSKVTYFMTGRSKSQVFNRWTYSINPSIKRGRFTKEEDMLVVAAVRRYGTDFARVARFIPGRTSIQVRDRYCLFLKCEKSGNPWTTDDDAFLLALVKEHGEGNWSKISQHFVSRNRIQVRRRYVTLQKWLKKVPVDITDVLPAPSRQLNVESNREEKIWNRVLVILQNMKEGTEMNENNLLKLKEKFSAEMRKRPGRKLGQKKVVSILSKQYYAFFRCVYAQYGGRQKIRYNEDVLQISGQVVYSMLKYFKAHLKIPKDDSAIETDHLLQEGDKLNLRYVRDREEHTDVNEQFVQGNASTNPCRDVLPRVVTPAEVPDGQIALAAILAQVANTSSALPYVPMFNLFDISFRIPYVCPPSHTTLVGFRTFLLSRRNIEINAGTRFKSFVTDTTHSGASSVSNAEKLTSEAAATLWRERLASLFLWPAIMSNTVPKVMDNLFQNDDASAANTSHADNDRNENDGTLEDDGDTRATKPKSNRKLSNKRKNRRKKKDAALPPPQKKRKYERSGKFKKHRECGLLRRSTRHAPVLQADC